jgi:selenocysteine lyase/cysteine desulfurase
MTSEHLVTGMLLVARLDDHGLVYLDYAGSGLPGRSQVAASQQILCQETLGNPHSENGPSRRSAEAMWQARRATLQFLNADPDEYSVIFTANATGALRLVGEAFQFRSAEGRGGDEVRGGVAEGDAMTNTTRAAPTLRYIRAEE